MILGHPETRIRGCPYCGGGFAELVSAPAWNAGQHCNSTAKLGVKIAEFLNLLANAVLRMCLLLGYCPEIVSFSL